MAASSIALFKNALELWDLIQLYQSHDSDFETLQLQFELEKCRLFNWGSEMGLCDDERQNLLEGCQFHLLVTKCLRQIIHLLSDAQSVRDKYGGVASNPDKLPLLEEKPHGYTTGVALAFGNFKTRQPSKESRLRTGMLCKTKWIIRDRKKFAVLIADVRNLVNGLQDITKDLQGTIKLEDALRKRVESIIDASTLMNIASAWKDSHPHIASAASTRAESLSCTSENASRVNEWRAHVYPDTNYSTQAIDLEGQVIKLVRLPELIYTQPMFNTISIGLVAVAFVVIRRWKVEKEFTLWEDAHAIYIIVLSGLMLLAMGTVMMKFNAILTSIENFIVEEFVKAWLSLFFSPSVVVFVSSSTTFALWMYQTWKEGAPPIEVDYYDSDGSDSSSDSGHTIWQWWMFEAKTTPE